METPTCRECGGLLVALPDDAAICTLCLQLRAEATWRAWARSIGHPPAPLVEVAPGEWR